jgi:hypothetical protein
MSRVGIMGGQELGGVVARLVIAGTAAFLTPYVANPVTSSQVCGPSIR